MSKAVMNCGPLTSEIYNVFKAREVERSHDVVSVQNPGRIHETHELKHLLL